MNWTVVIGIAEIVGATGVIISLIYLAQQIRQNTKSVLASSHQAISSTMNQLNSLIAQDEDAARIFVEGRRDLQALSEHEQARFHAIMLSIFNHIEDSYFQRQQGLIGNQYWERSCRFLQFYLGQPGSVETWKMAHGFFSDDFVAHVNAELSTIQDDNQVNGLSLP